MAVKKKIFNDPVYGFVEIPYGLIFELVEHPYFQRLRHIRQLGMTNLVYPGANHTRFQHALGAYYLMRKAIRVLREKGVSITAEEAEAVSAAILLHDIGHGPHSHALERSIMELHHEQLSLLIMERLNEMMGGRLDLAIEIFKGRYEKPFLTQLVSGQLDMDRMDYLNRDSYFTGVIEGRVGYDRIIKMLDVHDGRLVVEQKGIYSIEQFLAARRIMYWQVYLHKTVLAAELMLIAVFKRAKELARAGVSLGISGPLRHFLEQPVTMDLVYRDPAWIERFTKLDDCDVNTALKRFAGHPDKLLAFLAGSILYRKLFRLEYSKSSFSDTYVNEIKINLARQMEWLTEEYLEKVVICGIQSNISYNPMEEIAIQFKNGSVSPMSGFADYDLGTRKILKFYICYPKIKL